MLKLSTYLCILIVILLLVASNARENKHNIINIINASSYYEHCDWLNNLHDSAVNFTRVYQGLMSTSNETCTHDSFIEPKIYYLKSTVRDSGKLQKYQKSEVNDTSAYIGKNSISSSSTNSIHCYANDIYKIKSASSLNNISGIVKEKKQRDLFGYKWKRRTLCAVHDDRKHSTQTSFENNVLNVAKRKTLTDYDAPIASDDVEDTNSLKSHIRVKRGKSDWGPLSSYQQDYLKDLANSFPRNSYESIDENSYDDDVSFDAKREIKTEEFSASSDEVANENDNSIRVPDDIKNVRVSIDKGETANREIAEKSSKDDSAFAIRQSNDENVEIDPMLAVDLVRKKRKSLIGRTPSDSQNLDVKNPNRKLSSLVAANLKAHLLRVKRRAKKNRREKGSKTKKKKKKKKKKNKRGGKRQGKNSRRSLGNVKNANKLRTPRESKTNGGKSEGKSNVEITKVVSKENNENNFHRRFVESKKSVDNSKNDRSSKRLVPENNFDPASAIIAIGNDDDTTGPEDHADTSLTRNKDRQTVPEAGKLRENKNENAETSHGFLNKEDELKYYESIRESGQERQCNARIKRQGSVMTEGEGNRAVRSIEEVKELAKKLVTKVNELQNVINAEQSKTNYRRQKRIGTRAIDDLCSNVSTDYDVFNEPSQIVQECVPMGHKFSSTTEKIMTEGKIDSAKITKENKPDNEEKGPDSKVGKKRSIVRRVTKTSTSRTIRNEDEKPHHKWGRWTDWSSCSVTCGKGRQIRWRYCLRDCDSAETEMEEKACQLPACPPGKFLGIF